jgi:endoglucanase
MHLARMSRGLQALCAALLLLGSASAALAVGAPPAPLAAAEAPRLAGGVATAGPIRDLTSLQLSKEMSPGWNLGDTLEATPEETSWGNPLASQKLMNAVRAAGFRTVRIPVSWTVHADGRYTISKAWMARVTQVVNYARNADLYVILNVHSDGGWLQPTYAHQAEANAHLAKLWTQIAENFKSYDDHLLFAGTNEVMIKGQWGAPTAEYATVQNGFNQIFVNTVRASGGNNASRHLVVQGFNTNIDYTVASFVLPTDTVKDRLMLEIHYYDPYDFTMNDKSNIWQWGVISTDKSAVQAWANESHVDAQFEKMKTQFIDKGVAVILGEYAATPRLEHKESIKYVAYWDYYVTKSARQHGLVPVYWDNGPVGAHASGLFIRATGDQGLPDIIGLIMKAAQ